MNKTTRKAIPENMSNTRKAHDEDDWETDPDYINDVSEQEQRWGGKRDAGEVLV